MRSCTRLLSPLLLLLIARASGALAGGGPETTLVVVNGDSAVSRLVANEYVRLRDIPPGHVLYLDGVPHLGSVPIGYFKEKVWKPIQAYLAAEGLEDRIDYIAYSANFPYSIDFRSLLKGPETKGHQIGGEASWNGVTYLARHVMAGDRFWELAINRYFRINVASGRSPRRPPTAGERDLAAKARQALSQKRYEDAASAFGKLLSTYKSYSDGWYNFACCLARIGKLDDALKALRNAAETGFDNAAHATQDPDLEPLRRDPRFRGIIQGMQSTSAQFLPAHGFRSTYAWEGAPEPVREGSDSKSRYYLSTHLAWTGFMGNTVEEVLAYLASAAGCDGSRPDGTVYICKNADVRSTSRQQFFPSLTRGLEALGRKVEILEKNAGGQSGIIPVGKDDVIGAVVGSAGFRWAGSKSTLLPGAICDHLTSFGANFGTPGQTKLTEFLRYGAAGASGTVREPLSIHHKFPNPMIHVHYAEGCSLAEAFYQSVWGPYQLMIVGDGLARPFAAIPEVKVDAPEGPWSGTVDLGPSGGDLDFELWVDGRPVAAGDKLPLDTTKLADGHHEVRVVGVARDRIETRGYRRILAEVANGGAAQKIEYLGKPVMDYGDALVFRATPPVPLEVRCGSLTVTDESGRVSIDSARVGPGPVTLIARAMPREGPAYRAPPVRVKIEGRLRPQSDLPDLPRKPGLRGITMVGGKPKDIVLTNLGHRFSGLPVMIRLGEHGETLLELSGEMEAPGDGLYEIMFTGSGELTFSLGDETLLAAANVATMQSVPVWLARGWHPVSLRFVPKGRIRLEMMIGGDRGYEAPRFRHFSHPALSRPPKLLGVVGTPFTVSGDGVVLEWGRTMSDVAAVTLCPPKDARDFPQRWVVEVSAGRNKWKAVEDATTVIAQSEKDRIEFVEIAFQPVRVKRMRVRPENGAATRLARVEALGKMKSR